MVVSVVGPLLLLVILGMVLMAGVSLWKSKGLAAVLVVAGFLFILGLGLVSLLSVELEHSTPVTMIAPAPIGEESIGPDSISSGFNGPVNGPAPKGQGAAVIQSFPEALVTEIAPVDAAVSPEAGLPLSEHVWVPTPELANAKSAGNPSWMDADEDVFAIDHFPSVASAIGPLVRETMAKLEESEGSSTDAASDNSEAKRIYVWVKGADSKAFENEVLELVRTSLDGWEVQVTNGVQLKSLTLDLELQLRGGYLHVRGLGQGRHHPEGISSLHRVQHRRQDLYHLETVRCETVGSLL